MYFYYLKLLFLLNFLFILPAYSEVSCWLYGSDAKSAIPSGIAFLEDDSTCEDLGGEVLKADFSNQSACCYFESENLYLRTSDIQENLCKRYDLNGKIVENRFCLNPIGCKIQGGNVEVYPISECQERAIKSAPEFNGEETELKDLLESIFPKDQSTNAIYPLLAENQNIDSQKIVPPEVTSLEQLNNSNQPRNLRRYLRSNPEPYPNLDTFPTPDGSYDDYPSPTPSPTPTPTPDPCEDAGITISAPDLTDSKKGAIQVKNSNEEKFSVSSVSVKKIEATQKKGTAVNIAGTTVAHEVGEINDTTKISVTGYWYGQKISPPKQDLCYHHDESGEYEIEVEAELQDSDENVCTVTANSTFNISLNTGGIDLSQASAKVSVYAQEPIYNKVESNMSRCCYQLEPGNSTWAVKFDTEIQTALCNKLGQYKGKCISEEDYHVVQLTGKLSSADGGTKDLYDKLFSWDSVINEANRKAFRGKFCESRRRDVGGKFPLTQSEKITCLKAQNDAQKAYLNVMKKRAPDFQTYVDQDQCWREYNAKKAIGLGHSITAGIHYECAYPDCPESPTKQPLPGE